jgi:hypothetical protein
MFGVATRNPASTSSRTSRWIPMFSGFQRELASPITPKRLWLLKNNY